VSAEGSALCTTRRSYSSSFSGKRHIAAASAVYWLGWRKPCSSLAVCAGRNMTAMPAGFVIGLFLKRDALL
jgi:hypothetical protein